MSRVGPSNKGHDSSNQDRLEALEGQTKKMNKSFDEISTNIANLVMAINNQTREALENQRSIEVL